MTNRPLRVFLCHSSNDKPAVRELYQKLCAETWIEPWLDEEELYPGQDWDLEIEKAVESSDVILVCLSNSSINKKGYVQKELHFALDIALEMPEETIFMIPLRLEECTPPRSLRDWHYADYFQGNRDKAFQRLLISLKKRATSLGLKFDGLKFGQQLEEILDRMPRSGNEILDLFSYLAANESLQENIKSNKSQISQPNIISLNQNKIFDLWWKRAILGCIAGIFAYILIGLFSGGPYGTPEGAVVFVIGYGVAGLLIYPYKFSLVFLILGFFILMIIYGIFGNLNFISGNLNLVGYISFGSVLGFPAGALISRILYWMKIAR